MEAHLAAAEEDEGPPRPDAGRGAARARVQLGGVTQLREATRAAQGLPWLGTFWLDIKLGVRLLCKSLGAGVDGGLAIAIAIGLARHLQYLGTFVRPGLPLDEGDRVVAIQPLDTTAQIRSPRRSPTAGAGVRR